MASDFIGKRVAITGFDINVPYLGYNIKTGSEELLSRQVDASSEPFADHPSCPPIKGEFYGIQAIAKPEMPVHDGEPGAEITDLLDPDEESDANPLAGATFRIVLHYRISIHESVVTTNFIGTLYALGNITDTELAFAEDKQVQDAAVALNALADASHHEAAAIARITLDSLLTPTEDETVHDPQRLYEIAETVRDFEEQHGVDMKYRDAVLDLVTARLGAYPGTAFTVEAEYGILRDNDKIMFSDDFRDNFAILGIEFTPHLIIEGEQVINTGADTLAVVIPSIANDEDRIHHCYVPFQNITLLEPLVSNEEG